MGEFYWGHVLARAIPKKQFGFIQSKLYHVYFNTLGCGLVICLLAYSAMHPWRSRSKVERWEDYNFFFSPFLTCSTSNPRQPRYLYIDYSNFLE